MNTLLIEVLKELRTKEGTRKFTDKQIDTIKTVLNNGGCLCYGDNKVELLSCVARVAQYNGKGYAVTMEIDAYDIEVALRIQRSIEGLTVMDIASLMPKMGFNIEKTTVVKEGAVYGTIDKYLYDNKVELRRNGHTLISFTHNEVFNAMRA